MSNTPTEHPTLPTVEIVDEALIAATSMESDDVAVEPDQQPTLALAVAGTMEVPATDDGERPPVLMLFMADGTVRWHLPQESDPMDVSGA